MEKATSADGTRIAYESHGDGAPIVIVGGAMSTAEAGRPLAMALAASGLRGVPFDRRGRASSGDTAPYAPDREVEDIAAVIRAVGGEAIVLGHSSGAILAMYAAAQGAPITRLFLSEPPFVYDEPHDPTAADRLQALVDAGQNAEALATFQREIVGLDDAIVETVRRSPIFSTLLPLAQSVVYDATLGRDFPEPTPGMLGVGIPVTIMRGEPTFPVLQRAADRLHEAKPGWDLVVEPESANHALHPAATTRHILERL